MLLRLRCFLFALFAAAPCLALPVAAIEPLEPHVDPELPAPFPIGRALPEGAVASLLLPVEGSPQSVAFSPDGKLIAVGCSDRTVRLFGATSAKLQAALEGHAGPIHGVAFSPDGKYLASSSDDLSVRLWDVATQQLVRKFEGHKGPVKGVAFAPDGARLATCSEDRTIQLWDVATGLGLRSFEGHEAGVDAVTFSADGRTILSEAGDVTARLWDAATGRLLRVLPERDGSIASVAISPDGQLGLSTRGDATWHLFDIASGATVMILSGHRENGSAAAFAPDGRSVLTGSVDGTIRQWDLASGQELRRLTGYGGRVTGLAIDPSGTRLASVFADRRGCLWNLTAPPPKPRPSDRQPPAATLENAWSALGAETYETRLTALWRFLDDSDDALAFLVAHLPPTKPADTLLVERLIAQLDADLYVSREAAERELLQVGTEGRAKLREALEHPSPEVRLRVAGILRQRPPATSVREVLAVEALAWIKQPAARAHLEKLARGHREHPWTLQAQAVLGRPLKGP